MHELILKNIRDLFYTGIKESPETKIGPLFKCDHWNQELKSFYTGQNFKPFRKTFLIRHFGEKICIN